MAEYLTSRRRFIAAAAMTACSCALCPHALARAVEQMSPVDVGDLQQFNKDGPTDTWTHSHGFVLVRQNGRLYAVSAHCTHAGATLTPSGDELKCPRHGSIFDLSGAVREGPADHGLPRYGIQLNSQGHVVVDSSRIFREGHWNAPGAYLTLPH